MVKIDCKICSSKNSYKHKHCCSCGNELPITELEEKNGFTIFLIYIGNILISLWKGVIDNLYLIFLVVSIGYFIFYSIVADNELYFKGWESKKQTLSTLKNISYFIFSAGIFTSSLKYLQYLKVFEKEFERILSSEKYNKQIKDSVESITFSKKFLLKQNNIEEIWEKVTLCMYEKQFPELYNELKKNLKNELFKQNNISYYYKNQKIDFYISKVSEDLIKIEQTITYSIIRPSEKLFDWDFRVITENDISEDGKYPQIEIDFLNCDETLKSEDVKNEVIGNSLIKTVSKKLSGRREYHLKRKITLMQNLQNDRFWSFGSDRIIDDLDVNVQYDDTLNVIFTESMKQKKFIVQECREKNKKSYINRGLMLPGEKFKLFFLKI